MCKGELRSQPDNSWGCSRRFAQVDSLARHFRSEAGRICIKPLVDEEKSQQQASEQQSQMDIKAGPDLQPLPSGMTPEGSEGFSLPAALLVQYPALQNINWSQITSAKDGEDWSGEGHFNSSYGGSYYDEVSDHDSLYAGVLRL